jgi:hypothetical protein
MAIHDTGKGGSVTMEMVSQAITEQVGEMSMPDSLTIQPAEGETVELPQTSRDLFVTLDPASDLDSITIVLPSEAASRDTQALRIRTTRNIGQITVTGAVTIDNYLVMLNSGSVTVFFKFSSNTWSRVV